MPQDSQNYLPIPPDFNTWIRLMMKNFSANINCHTLGTIVSFNPLTQTATISINYKRVYVNANPNLPNPAPDGQTSNVLGSYPLIVNCPVIIMQGAGNYISFPIEEGDYCVVLFNDREITTWMTTGAVNAPQNQRTHDLSDAIALVGISPLTTPIQNYSSYPQLNSTNGMILSAGMLTIRMALDNLCMALTNWTGVTETNPPTTVVPTPATITAINAAKAQFDALFQNIVRTYNNNTMGSKLSGSALMGG